MSLVAKQDSSGNYPPVDAGNHHAICYLVVDLGTHYSEAYDKWSHKVLLTWELPALRIEVERDGQKKDLPRAISHTYTLSLHEKSILYQHLISWRGRAFTDEELEGFDLRNVAGKNCILNIVHKTPGKKTYAKVAAVTPLLSGVMKALPPENPVITYDIDEQGWDIPEGLPKWVKSRIMESKEYRESHQDINQNIDSSIPDDDIPF